MRCLGSCISPCLTAETGTGPFALVRGGGALLAAGRLMTRSSHLNAHDHSVLAAVSLLEQATTSQLERLCFAEPDTSPLSRGPRTRRKLARLFRQGHLRRFESSGTGGWVYLPENSRATRIDHHTLDVAEVYVEIAEAEAAGECRILEWTVRQQVTGRYADDAYLWLETPAGRMDWHLEIDRGMEYRPQLRDKMRAYERAYLHATDTFPAVLFIVTFNPRGSLDDRKAFIESVARQQHTPELFQVVTIEQGIPC